MDENQNRVVGSIIGVVEAEVERLLLQCCNEVLTAAGHAELNSVTTVQVGWGMALQQVRELRDRPEWGRALKELWSELGYENSAVHGWTAIIGTVRKLVADRKELSIEVERLGDILAEQRRLIEGQKQFEANTMRALSSAVLGNEVALLSWDGLHTAVERLRRAAESAAALDLGPMRMIPPGKPPGSLERNVADHEQAIGRIQASLSLSSPAVDVLTDMAMGFMVKDAIAVLAGAILHHAGVPLGVQAQELESAPSSDPASDALERNRLHKPVGHGR